MTVSELLAAVRTQLLGGAWNPLARGAWCRRQRRHLAVPGHAVVWIRGDVADWAEWGVRRGYFAMDRMDGIPYLCPASALAA
jgi:hypothetical protein